MKIINLNHSSYTTALEEMKKHGGDCVLDSVKGVYFIECKCEEKKVETKKVKKTTLVEKLDQDENNHITQEEVVKHFVKETSVKKAVEILDEIDADDNGRITKKEVKTFAEKGDK